MIIPNAKKKKKKPPRPACCDLPWPLWPHLLCSLSIPYSAYTVGLLVMPQQARHTPNPNLGPLHWLFPKPGLLHPWVAIGCSLTSFKSLPKRQLFSESISTHLFKNHNLLWYSVLFYFSLFISTWYTICFTYLSCLSAPTFVDPLRAGGFIRCVQYCVFSLLDCLAYDQPVPICGMNGKPKPYTCSWVGMWSHMINRATPKGKRQFLEVKDAGQTKISK